MIRIVDAQTRAELFLARDLVVTATDERHEARLEGASLQQDVTVATLAAKPDIGPEPIDEPVSAATRVGLPEADDVTEEHLQHGPRRHGRGAYQRRG